MTWRWNARLDIHPTSWYSTGNNRGEGIYTGQYHKVCNLTKKEFINPHVLGCGLKWIEQIGTFPGTGAALLILLGCPESRGGGDITGEGDGDVDKVAGRWHGDRVALVGDYAENGDIKGLKGIKLKGLELDKAHGWTDISALVAKSIEKLFDGRYEGDGWRNFKPKDEKSFVTSACECCRKDQARMAGVPAKERKALRAREKEAHTTNALAEAVLEDES